MTNFKLFAYINMETYRILSLKSLSNNYYQVMNEWHLRDEFYWHFELD